MPGEDGDEWGANSHKHAHYRNDHLCAMRIFVGEQWVYCASDGRALGTHGESALRLEILHDAPH